MFAALVGILIVLIGLFGFSLFWWALTSQNLDIFGDAQEAIIFNSLHVRYDSGIPPFVFIAAAIVAAFSVALIFIGLEIRDINASRRSHDDSVKPLAPWVMMNKTRGVFHGEVSVTILIPAHNEAANIANTLNSLSLQTRKPDRVIVVADNCTDETSDIAQAMGYQVIESVENSYKKAGALNQVLHTLLPTAGPNDTFMIMDADTVLRPLFIETAVRYFTNDRGLSAIGGLFYGEEGHGIIGQLQRNEYFRYQREIERRKGRVFVLTGTASIFRGTSLREVQAQRGNLLPGQPGNVYDTAALTEDNELTIALKTLGALMMSPQNCQVETELMPSAVTLWRQRLRWQRGALENIATYGITAATTRYWSQQLGIAYSIFALWSFFLLIFLQVVSLDGWVWFPYWLAMGGVFALERVHTVWQGGWKARFLALALFPELLYDSFLDLVFLKGVADMALKRDAQWGHERVEARKAMQFHELKLEQADES